MSRFTRFSRVSPLELCRMQERRAWCCAGGLFVLFGGLAVAGLICPAPGRCRVGELSADFAGMQLVEPEGEQVAAVTQVWPNPLPPLPLVEVVAELPLALEFREAAEEELFVEWEPLPATEEHSLLVDVGMPEQLSAPTPRRSVTASAARERGGRRAGEKSAFVAASYRRTPRPPYPPELQQRRLEGRVGLCIEVDAEGVPQEVEVCASSGYVAMDCCAREWVRAHWRFYPAQQDGVAVASIVRTQLDFVLR